MSTDSSTVSLPRGAACALCRQRKIKCDGQKPTCGQCIRSDRQAQCEYRDTRSPSNARALEQHIARLESRIEELSADANSVRLQNPYSTVPIGSGSVPVAQIPGAPSANVASTFVQVFLAHASKFGFFLDIPRLIEALRTDPGMTGSNPLTLLRAVMCLLGMHLSRDPVHTSGQDNLSAGILQRLHSALSNAQDNRHATIYVLQAEILLAHYFFDNNRLLEGRLHTQAAVSLAMICRLHKVGMGSGSILVQNVAAANGAWLPPPADRVEHRERINAWWQTFILDKSWAVVLASPSMIEDTVGLDATVDTPWPLDDGDGALDGQGRRLFQGRTVQQFFENVLLDTRTSSLGLHAKAAALYERAHHTALFQRSNLPRYDVAVAALDTSIECFMQILPTLQAAGSSSHFDANAHAQVTAYTLCYCATIQLHRGLVGQSVASMAKCFAAARMVARLSQHFDVANIRSVNPIIAVLWAAAADALVHSLRTLRNFNGNGGGGATLGMPNEEAIVSSLNILTSALAAFGQFSPLFGDQLNNLQAALGGI